MHTKGRFGVSRNTDELVGIADDALDNDILIRELKDLDKNADDNEDADVKLPEMAQHFLVFIATTWVPEGKIQFLVARWGLKSITGAWLARNIEMTIMSLAQYGLSIPSLAMAHPRIDRATKLWRQSLLVISCLDLLQRKNSMDCLLTSR